MWPLLLLVVSSLLAFDDDGWKKFDEKTGRMKHVCGDAYLCRNRYRPNTLTSSASDNNLQNDPWNISAVIWPQMMNDKE